MVITACGTNELRHDDTGESAAEPTCYAFEAQYIRTNCLEEGEIYPRIIPIITRRDLDDYINCNRDKYYDLKALESALDTYDEAWFDCGRMLLIVVVEEGSGSVHHEVTCLTRDRVTIDRIVPDIRTDDMAQWHILIATDMGDISEEFQVVFTESSSVR